MADTAIEWVSVPGHPGYSVTIGGTLRGPRKILRPMAMPSGHQYVITGARRKLWVHHAVLLAFVGPRPASQECRHLNGDPADNTLGNLRWGTRMENTDDKRRHGTIRRGATSGTARLTEEQVAIVRIDNRLSRVVAADFGVSHTAVLKVRRGQTWRAA